jgi:hypothetical protein
VGSQRENNVDHSLSITSICMLARRAGELPGEAMGEDTDTSRLSAPGALILTQAGALGQLIEPIGGKIQQCTKVAAFTWLIPYGQNNYRTLGASDVSGVAASPLPFFMKYRLIVFERAAAANDRLSSRARQ